MARLNLPRLCVVCSKPLTHPRGFTCGRAHAIVRSNWRRRTRAVIVGPRYCRDCNGLLDPALRAGSAFCEKKCQGRWFQRVYWRRKHGLPEDHPVRGRAA